MVSLLIVYPLEMQRTLSETHLLFVLRYLSHRWKVSGALMFLYRLSPDSSRLISPLLFLRSWKSEAWVCPRGLY
jgi:hypothetical protein